MNLIDDTIDLSLRAASLCMQQNLSADEVRLIELANKALKRSDQTAKAGDAHAAAELLEEARTLIQRVETREVEAA